MTSMKYGILIINKWGNGMFNFKVRKPVVTLQSELETARSHINDDRVNLNSCVENAISTFTVVSKRLGETIDRYNDKLAIVEDHEREILLLKDNLLAGKTGATNIKAKIDNLLS